MLVLSRKGNESIMIGDAIEVFIVSIRGEKVCIGVEAPRWIPVFRKEIYVEKQRDRAEKDEQKGIEARSAASFDPAPKTVRGRSPGRPPSETARKRRPEGIGE